MNRNVIIGIDEVGRGPLAGPIVVAAVALPRALIFKNAPKSQLNDSKKMTERHRNEWSKYLKAHSKVYFAIAKVSPGTVDRINISQAANRAAKEAHASLVGQLKRKSISGVYLDGGLYLGKKGENTYKYKVATVIRGDQKITAIMAASVIAKVYRDALMRRMAKKYPVYAFELNKGYGTQAHLKAIRKHGPSPIHRLTFLH